MNIKKIKIILIISFLLYSIAILSITNKDNYNLDDFTYDNRITPEKSVDSEIKIFIWSKDKKRYLKGTLKKENDVYNGICTLYFENGEINRQGLIVNSKLMGSNIKLGVEHGEWKEWDANGKISIIRNYNNGKKHGKFISYNENDEIILTSIYENDELVFRQRKDEPPIPLFIPAESFWYEEFKVWKYIQNNKSTHFFISGEKYAEGKIDNTGKKIGEWTFYHKNGNIESKGDDDNGVVTFYKDDGSLWMKVYYKNNKEYKAETFNKQGELIQVEISENGKLTEEIFYENGKEVKRKKYE